MTESTVRRDSPRVAGPTCGDPAQCLGDCYVRRIAFPEPNSMISVRCEHSCMPCVRNSGMLCGSC